MRLVEAREMTEGAYLLVGVVTGMGWMPVACYCWLGVGLGCDRWGERREREPFSKGSVINNSVRPFEGNCTGLTQNGQYYIMLEYLWAVLFPNIF